MKNLLITQCRICLIATTVLAQQHMTTVQPQYAQPATSGYDPFQLDWSTGRFNYVPQPYDIQPAGAGYNPYQINWYSGQFDYVPVPPPQQLPMKDPQAAGGNASNYIDTRVSPLAAPIGQVNSTPAPAATLAPISASYSIYPPAKPTTAPTTHPATAPASESLGRIRSAHDLANGRWEFDYSTGKWAYVLPPG